jgi:hypothetical protein
MPSLLSFEKCDVQRHLLFSYAKAFATEAEYRQYITDIQVFANISHELVDEAIASFLQEKTTDNVAVPAPVGVKNPYKGPPPRPPLLLQEVQPNLNSSNSGKVGHPHGSKNKAGHKTGGNRKDAAHVTITRDQRSIKPYGIIIKPTSEMGASDASESSDDPHSDSESEHQQKADVVK